ncbi:MAG: type I glyceraldehyde-3-phosphate dehydrogenase [Pseudomonadota bacterium]
MTINIAINGFGRIGRCVLRALLERQDRDIRIVAINDLADPATSAHLLKFDSVHGRLNTEVRLTENAMHVSGQEIALTAIREPEALPWDNVDIAFECTGRFTTRTEAARHLQNGSRRVLISAPGKNVDRTVVFGVNHDDLIFDDVIVSNASCTTNCLAPLAQVLDREFGIETGYMTTIHAYTGDQPSHDTAHRDLYRARAAGLSMIPTSTGAARAIAEVLPQLKGRLEGSAVRVPTANVSMVDLSFMPQRETSVEGVNAAVKSASDTGPLARVLSYEDEPLVSVDFNHDSHSSCFAAAQTTVTQNGMVRVVSWYDNEWGFSNRMLDTSKVIGQLLKIQNGMQLAS